MNIFIIQHNYSLNYLVVIDNNIVDVYKQIKHNYDEPDISFQPKHIFTGKSRICQFRRYKKET